jgi:peroxiredoxin Q/BCP
MRLASVRVLCAGLCTLGFLAWSVSGVLGQEKGKGKAVSTLKVGDKAPSFESVDDEGKSFKSSDVIGKKVVAIFFFPAALTGG